MKLTWVSTAVEDLSEVYRYIAQDDAAAAQRTLARIRATVTTILPMSPNAGKPGRVDGTRELVISGTPYIVPYRVRGETIEVLRVYHGARRWPDRL